MNYNGWSNYETWNVALWMDNDAGSQPYWVERAEALVADADGDKEEAEQQLAEEIKASHEENMPALDGTFSDLLTAALGEVDWREIASHFVADVEYESDDAEAA